MARRGKRLAKKREQNRYTSMRKRERTLRERLDAMIALQAAYIKNAAELEDPIAELRAQLEGGAEDMYGTPGIMPEGNQHEDA